MVGNGNRYESNPLVLWCRGRDRPPGCPIPIHAATTHQHQPLRQAGQLRVLTETIATARLLSATSIANIRVPAP